MECWQQFVARLKKMLIFNRKFVKLNVIHRIVGGYLEIIARSGCLWEWGGSNYIFKEDIRDAK